MALQILTVRLTSYQPWYRRFIAFYGVIKLFEQREDLFFDEGEPKPLYICGKNKSLNTSTGLSITDIFPKGLLDLKFHFYSPGIAIKFAGL